jgi:hypothetical protein
LKQKLRLQQLHQNSRPTGTAKHLGKQRLKGYLDFPHAEQAFMIERRTEFLRSGQQRTEIACGVAHAIYIATLPAALTLTKAWIPIAA